MKVQSTRLFHRCFVFELVLLCTLVSARSMAVEKTVMPVSRLTELKNIKWTAMASQQKEIALVKPTLTTSTAKLKMTVPGYETAAVRKERTNFLRVDIPGAGVTAVVGQPELPVIRRLVAVPEGAEIKVTIKQGEAKIIEKVQLYPVQEPIPEQATKLPYSRATKFAFNRDFYKMDKPYPSEVVTVSPPMKMRDLTVVEIEIAAMQYNGAKDQSS